MRRIKRIIRIIGIPMAFVIPIMESVFANTVNLKDPKSILLLLKNPLFWICLAIYLFFQIIPDHESENETDSKESREQNNESNVEEVPSNQQAKTVNNYDEYERDVIEREGEARKELIKATLESAKNKDFETAERLIKIYRELDEIIYNRRRGSE